MRMDIIRKLTEELKVERWQVEAAVKLIDEGNTIPFISRYRKEVTGSLNDEQLRDLFERLNYLRNLEEKKEQVLASIEEQGKLDEELKAKILACSAVYRCQSKRSGRRSLSSFPAEKKDQSQCCQGEGTGRACRVYSGAGNRRAFGKRGGKICE